MANKHVVEEDNAELPYGLQESFFDDQVLLDLEAVEKIYSTVKF